MKKKLWLVTLVIVTFFINACSCKRVDLRTYNSAVKNFNNSTGYEYTLKITTETNGEGKYYLEEGTHKFRLTPTRIVDNFASQIKQYEISRGEVSGNAAPQLMFELNRYYVGNQNKFYSNHVQGNNDIKSVHSKTYEQMYDENSEYNINNLFPIYGGDYISNFSIVKDENRKGYSIATFSASCPATVECDGDITRYTTTINPDNYFESIKFTVVNTVKQFEVVNGETVEVEYVTTTNYEYKFSKYNSEVQIVFPSDLNNY